MDAATGQPIAGAVVLAVWWKAEATPVHGVTHFYDAREVVSGPDGFFEIARLKVPFFTIGIRPPQFTVFAPGYAVHRWAVTPPGGEPLVHPTVIEVRALRAGKERLDSLPSRPSIPAEKMCLLTRAISQERQNVGLTPLRECVP